MTDEARFLAALPLIDDVTAQVCRRHHLDPEDAEDFGSDVRMHFIERNYEVLRRFEGRASLNTYVSVVVNHLLLDRRKRVWGRWRPTTDARRLGPAGVLLERLVTRDRWTTEQALEMLRVNHGVVVDDSLRAFCDTLAARAPGRQFVTEENAEELAGDGPAADANVVRAEQDFLARRVHSALDRARQALAPMERLILKMRFEDRVTVADIARALHLNQRRLYRAIEGLLETIRASMMAEGISKSDIEAVLADGAVSWSQLRDAVHVRIEPVTHPPENKRASWRQGQ